MKNATPLSDIKPAQLVAGIREWVSLETPPHDVPRLQEFAQLACYQAQQLGLIAELIPASDTQQSLVRIRAHSESNEKAVLVLAHYDTDAPHRHRRAQSRAHRGRQDVRARHL